MTNLDSILKSINITLLTKAYIVKAMVFPVVMYACEIWTIKMAEHWRIDAFELWCWRRLLRVPWTPRRSNETFLREINPDCSLEELMLSWSFRTLATWCEEPTHWKRPRCWERLKAGGEGDNRARDGWMASLTQWTWVWASSGRQWRTGKPGVLQSMVWQRVGHDWVTEQQQFDWATELKWTELNWMAFNEWHLLVPIFLSPSHINSELSQWQRDMFWLMLCCAELSHSVVSNSLRPCGL